MFQYVSALEVVPARDSSSIIAILPDELGSHRQTIPDDITEQLRSPMYITFSAADVRTSLARLGKTVEYFEWSVGEFSPTEEEGDTVTFYFRKPGSHRIILTAYTTDMNDMPIKKEFEFTIPKGTFVAELASEYAPAKVRFDAGELAKAYDGIMRFEWNFDVRKGDEKKVTTQPSITHTYEKDGSYDVELVIVDNDQRVYRFNKTIALLPRPDNVIIPRYEVKPQPKQLEADVFEVSQHTPYNFDAGSSESQMGKIVKYQWKFSDRTGTFNTDSVTRGFNKTGEVEVVLTLSDDQDNEATSRFYLSIAAAPSKPEANVRTTPEFNERSRRIVGPTPLQIEFDASRSFDSDNDIIRYEWDVDGDDEIDWTGEKITHVYRNPGKFNVTLKVEDSEGNTDEVGLEVFTEKPAMNAEILTETIDDEVPCTIKFDGSLSSCADCNIRGYEWIFGDGTKSELTGAQVTHVYDAVGVFTVTLKAYTENDVAETTKDVFCREKSTKACIGTNRSFGEAPLSVRFDPHCSEGTINSYQWDFDDGTTSSEMAPYKTFQDPGEYNVQLTILDEQNIKREAWRLIIVE